MCLWCGALAWRYITGSVRPYGATTARLDLGWTQDTVARGRRDAATGRGGVQAAATGGDLRLLAYAPIHPYPILPNLSTGATLCAWEN
jgi:hypothetical protein